MAVGLVYGSQVVYVTFCRMKDHHHHHHHFWQPLHLSLAHRWRSCGIGADQGTAVCLCTLLANFLAAHNQ